MKKRVFTCIVVLLSTFAVATSGGEKKTTRQSLRHMVMTPEQAVMNEFFRQFTEDYVPPLTVEEQIAAFGYDPVLCEATLENEEFAFQWYSDVGTLDILLNGERLEDLEVDYTNPDRITWEAMFVKVKENRHVFYEPELTGFITAGNDSLILQVVVSGEAFRIRSSPEMGSASLILQVPEMGGVSGGGVYPVSVEAAFARCVCWGRPPKGSCTIQACDDAEGCTGGPGECTWRACRL